MVYLWLDGKRIVDFLLVIIQLFSLSLTAEALLSEIYQKRHFLKGWVTLSANYRYMGTSPAIDLWIVRQRNDVAVTLPLDVFTRRNVVANFFRWKLNFTNK